MRQSTADFCGTNFRFSPAAPAHGLRLGFAPPPGPRRNLFAAKPSSRECHFASVVIGGTTPCRPAAWVSLDPALFEPTSFFHSGSWRTVLSWERFLARRSFRGDCWQQVFSRAIPDAAGATAGLSGSAIRERLTRLVQPLSRGAVDDGQAVAPLRGINDRGGQEKTLCSAPGSCKLDPCQECPCFAFEEATASDADCGNRWTGLYR